MTLTFVPGSEGKGGLGGIKSEPGGLDRTFLP